MLHILLLILILLILFIIQAVFSHAPCVLLGLLREDLSEHLHRQVSKLLCGKVYPGIGLPIQRFVIQILPSSLPCKHVCILS